MGQRYTVANELSRRPLTVADIAEAKAKRSINDFILIELNSLQVSPILLDDQNPILANNYLDDSQKIATYLITFCQPLEIDIKEFNAFKKKAVKFKVQDNHLFC